MADSNLYRIAVFVLLVAVPAHADKKNVLHTAGPQQRALGPDERALVVRISVANTTKTHDDDYRCDWELLSIPVANQATAYTYIFNWRDYRPDQTAWADILCPHNPASEGRMLQLTIKGRSAGTPSGGCLMWWRGPGTSNTNMATAVIQSKTAMLPTEDILCQANTKPTIA